MPAAFLLGYVCGMLRLARHSRYLDALETWFRLHVVHRHELQKLNVALGFFGVPGLPMVSASSLAGYFEELWSFAAGSITDLAIL